ncbi:MAG: Stk1 family PASTA domain-containing Ser/Thr kinase [Schaalia hyovaginalis]|uniref:Stk1 family PASTA domain-containing Ser/Thr kinase n=1 Tax=Schaalia hyovaginalis TaxID=29316 RepID=UPI002A90BE12|nr:Stk1 family PASTA domain-containing Ser/Thr kinase [Schaalia hyovaginalis]MDY6214598.1 Stk1 family PASTA domain-containing Ser/Thr kinase [Schaalia hyovaginalis]
MIGMLLDERYRIQRRLARGGMATVYLAQDERLDRPVALKIMHPHLAESADFVARFRREARSAARIIHPGVVSVFDQGVIHGQGFLVMEFIDGPNLRTLLNQEGALSIRRTLQILHDVLDALRAAHRVGVIHRDIKPENVLMPADPPARVTDFGLARAASEVSMSTTGSMLGTIAYIAPEIAVAGAIDERTDLYSVGIMAYEMLTGSVPWEGEPALQIAQHHVLDTVPEPSRALPWIPREIDDLIASLTARDPLERPADAAEALDQLARVQAAIPAELGSRRAEVAPKAPAPATGEIPAPTSPLPEPLPATSQAVVHAHGPESPPPATAKKRRRIGRIIAVLVLLAIIGTGGGWWWWTEYGPGSYITMPQTALRSASAVESDLAALGLGAIIEEEFSDTVPEGQVVSSDPEGGQPVHKDAEVRLVVSKGVDMRIVPDVVGSSKAQAKALLEAAGLALGDVEEEFSEEVPEGSVISQKIEKDSSIPHDTQIGIVVSKGREPLSVPKLAGLSADEAKAALEGLGLSPRPTEEFSDSVPAGTVVSQSTAESTTLFKGDEVSYVVSKGPENVQVPSVQGKQESEAITILQGAGLQVRVERVLGGIFGTARSTDPGAGDVVKIGSTITLYVV